MTACSMPEVNAMEIMEKYVNDPAAACPIPSWKGSWAQKQQEKKNAPKR